MTNIYFLWVACFVFHQCPVPLDWSSPHCSERSAHRCVYISCCHHQVNDSTRPFYFYFIFVRETETKYVRPVAFCSSEIKFKAKTSASIKIDFGQRFFCFCFYHFAIEKTTTGNWTVKLISDCTATFTQLNWHSAMYTTRWTKFTRNPFYYVLLLQVFELELFILYGSINFVLRETVSLRCCISVIPFEIWRKETAAAVKKEKKQFDLVFTWSNV